ncbi:phospholipase D-like domain-containing protein [Vibrio cyclitrophicus]|uniref:phospholipase D family protein n=1 Tax=Vibrio cyclitrophicus TaxID=47951 RepID=UPI000C8354C5|nr:phospholipase D family protein [Vibrio cyclitrophicus]
MKMFLHSPDQECDIRSIYQQAFNEAVELYVVTAYLTDWDMSLNLNKSCENFRIIIGKDFGITRKSACYKVMQWLPSERKSQFLVADNIDGFHPKAIFWKDASNKCHALIGSSNLTKAAFESNYEANIYSEIDDKSYYQAKNWVGKITEKAVVVSEDWLAHYVEGTPSNKKKASRSSDKNNSIVSLPLPQPTGAKAKVEERRKQILIHQSVKSVLHELFVRCASGEVSSSEFYAQLPELWNWELGNRLQGKGWERRGKASDFHELSISYLKVVQSLDFERDDVVVREIDRLKTLKVSARTAFFSEMLCLTYPERYPVLNKPVWAYLEDMKFRAPKGASQGVSYIDLAKKLRLSLQENLSHPAQNLAELDTVIWLQYHE